MFVTEVDKSEAWYRKFSYKCPFLFFLMNSAVCSALSVERIRVQLYLPPPCWSLNKVVPIIPRVIRVKELKLFKFISVGSKLKPLVCVYSRMCVYSLLLMHKALNRS